MAIADLYAFFFSSILAVLMMCIGFLFGCCRNDVKGSISETLDEDEEILGSDDDEQEDPRDYTKGKVKQEAEPELLCF